MRYSRTFGGSPCRVVQDELVQRVKDRGAIQREAARLATKHTDLEVQHGAVMSATAVTPDWRRAART